MRVGNQTCYYGRKLGGREVPLIGNSMIDVFDSEYTYIHKDKNRKLYNFK